MKKKWRKNNEEDKMIKTGNVSKKKEEERKEKVTKNSERKKDSEWKHAIKKEWNPQQKKKEEIIE